MDSTKAKGRNQQCTSHLVTYSAKYMQVYKFYKQVIFLQLIQHYSRLF